MICGRPDLSPNSDLIEVLEDLSRCWTVNRPEECSAQFAPHRLRAMGESFCETTQAGSGFIRVDGESQNDDIEKPSTHRLNTTAEYGGFWSRRTPGVYVMPGHDREEIFLLAVLGTINPWEAG